MRTRTTSQAFVAYLLWRGGEHFDLCTLTISSSRLARARKYDGVHHNARPVVHMYVPRQADGAPCRTATEQCERP